MGCLDENVVQGFVEGRLGPDELRRVDEHLDGCAGCRMLAAEMVRRTAPTSGETVTLDALSGLQRGSTLDRFHIVQKLGAGAMGVVYTAYDPILDRRCAIKVLRPELGIGVLGMAPGERLVREARALARLNHPNVVAVHEIGSAGSQSFVVMELVEGETLTRWLARERRPWREVLRCFIAAGRGLAAAHSLGLVHRDFKPDNVLVGRDGRVRVSDFGLARLGGSSLETLREASDPESKVSAEVTLTRTGALLGSPAYMAPEVLDGSEASTASDQFSFCVALVEALYGKRPFDVSSLASLRAAHRAGWRPPHRRLPQRVAALLARGLSEEPAARFPSLSALLDSLERSAKPMRPAPLVGAAVIAALVIATVFNAQRATVCSGAENELAAVWNPERRDAIRAALRAVKLPYGEASLQIVETRLNAWASRWVSARTEACRATRVREEQPEEVLTRQNACLDERRMQLSALVGVFAKADQQVAERAVHALDALGDVSECEQLEVVEKRALPGSGEGARVGWERVVEQIGTARVLHEAGRHAAGLEEAKAAVEAARALGSRAAEAEALEILGVLQQKSGDAKSAVRSLMDAVLAAEASDQDQLAALAWVRLVHARAVGLTDIAGALEADAHARALIARLADDELEAHRLYNLAGAKWAAGDLGEAHRLYVETLEIRERHHLEPHQSTVAALVGIADTSLRMGRMAEAVPSYERAAEELTKLLGGEHPEVAAVLQRLGNALAFSGEPLRAKDILGRVIALRERTLGAEDPSLCNTWGSLGIAHSFLGAHEESARALRRSVDVCEKALGPEHPSTTRARANLAEALVAAGRSDEALPLFFRALAMREKLLGKDHPDLSYPLAGLGNALRLTGRSREALPYLERAVRLTDRVDRSAVERAQFSFRLAQALRDLDPRSTRARRLALDARRLLEDVSGTEAPPLRDEIEKWLAEAR